MSNSSIEMDESELRHFLKIIWRRKLIIFVSVIVITVPAVVYSQFYVVPQYQSSVELLQRRLGLNESLLGSNFFQGYNDPDRVLQTAEELVQAPSVALAVKEELKEKIPDGVPSVSTSHVKGSDILRITATDTDPELAADVANQFAVQYINWRRHKDHETLQSALVPLEEQLNSIPPEQKESAYYNALSDRIDNLKLLEKMQIEDLEIVKPATVSTSPTSPKPVRTSIIALITSLFFGIGATFLREHSDTRVRNPDEVRQSIDKPVLAAIPKISSRNGGFLVTLSEPANSCSEAYRLLKTNLEYADPDNDLKSIMVTSPRAKDGKSSTVSNLAITMARSGMRVIILDGDFRNPSLARYFGLENSVGITNVIAGKSSFRKSCQKIDAKDITIPNLQNSDGGKCSLDLNGARSIYCCPTGPLPPNPGEIMASKKIGSLIEEASKYADLVMVDAPPFELCSDAASLASKVDGVMIVLGITKARRKHLHAIDSFIDSIPSNVLGVVITKVKSRGSYSYAYGPYNYG